MDVQDTQTEQVDFKEYHHKPEGLEQAKAINMPETMPELRAGEILICSYNLLDMGEKYVACLSQNGLEILKRSYDPAILKWYILTLPLVPSTQINKK